jgi:hypothetical protein
MIEPKDPKRLNHVKTKGTLNYLMFLKTKRNRTMKGRGHAYERRQRMCTKKEGTSSPAVGIESFILSCTIDAMKQLDIAVVNILGTFIQVDAEETILMRLGGKWPSHSFKLTPLHALFQTCGVQETVLWPLSR